MTYTPNYQISYKILDSVAASEAAKELIENSPIIPQWERTFQGEAMARTVHHSTALEGNELKLSDTEKIIRGERIETYRQRDVKEILNYRKVIDFLSGYTKKDLTIGFIFKIHKILGSKILDPKYLGCFRTKNAVIINSRDGNVVFDPPHHHDIAYEMEELLDWYNNKSQNIHELIKAGIIHYEIVRIHPFSDLNGRTARILATWSLYKSGYEINKFFSLEEYYDQNPKSYYNALDSANEGDLTVWLEYFTHGVELELKRIKNRVQDLSMDRRLKHRIGQIALNERQLILINFLMQKESLTNKDFSALFPNISDDTILRDIADLMDKKIIRKKGKTRGAVYFLV